MMVLCRASQPPRLSTTAHYFVPILTCQSDEVSPSSRWCRVELANHPCLLCSAGLEPAPLARRCTAGSADITNRFDAQNCRTGFRRTVFVLSCLGVFLCLSLLGLVFSGLDTRSRLWQSPIYSPARSHGTASQPCPLAWHGTTTLPARMALAHCAVPKDAVLCLRRCRAKRHCRATKGAVPCQKALCRGTLRHAIQDWHWAVDNSAAQSCWLCGSKRAHCPSSRSSSTTSSHLHRQHPPHPTTSKTTYGLSHMNHYNI